MNEQVTRLRQAVIGAAAGGPGKASQAARRAAFANRDVDPRARPLLEIVTRCAWTVADGDVAGVRQAGMTDDEIFELVVCAALGQATRQLEAALSVLDEAGGETADEAARRRER
jgi:hypothetical protein